MGFLKNLFKKKPGGTFFGNLLRGVSSAATGGILGSGANRIEVGQTATNKDIAADPSKSVTFAGQAATQSADGTITMTQPLKEVVITPQAIQNQQPAWLEKLGDKLSYLGGRTTEQTAVGVDNKTLMIVGGGLFALVLVMMLNKK